MSCPERAMNAYMDHITECDVCRVRHIGGKGSGRFCRVGRALRRDVIRDRRDNYQRTVTPSTPS